MANIVSTSLSRAGPVGGVYASLWTGMVDYLDRARWFSHNQRHWRMGVVSKTGGRQQSSHPTFCVARYASVAACVFRSITDRRLPHALVALPAALSIVAGPDGHDRNRNGARLLASSRSTWFGEHGGNFTNRSGLDGNAPTGNKHQHCRGKTYRAGNTPRPHRRCPVATRYLLQPLLSRQDDMDDVARNNRSPNTSLRLTVSKNDFAQSYWRLLGSNPAYSRIWESDLVRR